MSRSRGKGACRSAPMSRSRGKGGRAASVAAFYRGRAHLGFPNPGQVEFLRPVEPVDPVLLLMHVRQLRVAVAKHLGVIQEYAAKSGEPLVELRDRLRPFAVPPRILHRIRLPPDTAEFAAEVRLPAIW